MRGGQIIDPWVSPEYTPTSDFTDHGNGAVTHTKTSLTWKRCAEGQTWSGGTCTGTAATYAWADATALTQSYAGYSDWRLPTQNELLTIVEWNTINPAINSTIFPKTPASGFWSASAYAGSSGNAWNVDFYDGLDGGNDKADPGYVRLVRGGQSFGTSSPSLSLSGLTLSCPATLAAGASATCSATASYSDGSSKGVSATWTSSNPAALSVSGATGTASTTVTAATPVTLTASYTENGATKTATALVTVQAAVVTPVSLELTCPADMTAGSTGNCSVIATYSDGKKAAPAQATWSVTPSSAASVDASGKVSAAKVTADTPITVNVSLTENGKTVTASKTLTIKVAPCQPNTGEITIVGTAVKKLGESLDVRYRLCSFNKATYFDVYIAVQIPTGEMYFLSSTGGFFATPVFTLWNGAAKPAAYLTNTLVPDLEGSALSMSVTPLTLPTGSYTFYAIPVPTGKDGLIGYNWVGNLASGVVSLIK